MEIPSGGGNHFRGKAGHRPSGGRKVSQAGTDGFLDTGTTSGELAKVIAELPWHLTVLINSLQVASIISQSDMHTLYLADGRYDMAADSFHDMDTAS